MQMIILSGLGINNTIALPVAPKARLQSLSISESEIVREIKYIIQQMGCLYRHHVDPCLTLCSSHQQLKMAQVSSNGLLKVPQALSRVQERKAVEYIEDTFMDISGAFKKRLASMRSASSIRKY
jgi:hypothetical protein